MNIYFNKLANLIVFLSVFLLFPTASCEEIVLENGVWKNRKENNLKAEKDNRHSFEKYGNQKNNGIVNNNGVMLLNKGFYEYDLRTQASCYEKIALFKTSALNDYNVKEVNFDDPSHLDLYMRDGQSIFMSCKGSTLFIDVRN